MKKKVSCSSCFFPPLSSVNLVSVLFVKRNSKKKLNLKKEKKEKGNINNKPVKTNKITERIFEQGQTINKSLFMH